MSTKSQRYFRNKPIKKDEGTGGIQIATVSFALPTRKSCAECPLRRDSKPGYLGGYTPEMYIEVLHGPASIACHTSFDNEKAQHKQRHCTGVAVFRANVDHVCKYPFPDEGGFITTGAQVAVDFMGKNTTDYFASDEEFVEHHKPGQAEG